MNHFPEEPQEFLNSLPGYHQYLLDAPARLCFASRDLCERTGYAPEELCSETEDLYACLVHPADRAAYTRWLAGFSQPGQKGTLQYRILKADGAVRFVSDTLTARRLESGAMVGDSILTDITQLKTENTDLQFLNDTIPCGFLKYTCEKQPKITYINDRMRSFLRFSPTDTAQWEFCKGNIFLLIPMEERRRFADYLDRVYTQGTPIAGEMTILRADGTKAYLFGWVTKSVNDRGEEEFQSGCMDISQRHQKQKEQETQRYLKALAEVYDKIFEYDLSAGTVQCLHGQSSPMFRWLENIPMQMEDATEKWIMSTVQEQDRETVRAFFRDFYQKKLPHSSRPPQITYHALSSTGTVQRYRGLFLNLDTNVSLFCCRRMAEDQETDELRSENTALKNMQQLVMRFTEGVVAFEVENDTVTPLYTSDNVCSFFGYTREQWLSLSQKRLSIREFISQSGIAYQDVQTLFAAGEAEFTYFDMTQNAYRRIKAICSRRSPDESSPRYVMLYNVDDREMELPKSPEIHVQIRTFGYFDVFVDDKPIAFRNEKSKELFALLVDRRGGFVSSEEAISFLWEDETANPVTLARYRKVALRLKNILEEYGISDIVESVNGKRRIVTDRVRCDLYDYLSGQEEYAQLFKGSYLTNYSWGESTLAQLTGEHLMV